MNELELRQHLDEYLKEPTPFGCLLIKGHWGSGKTYFITNYLEEQFRQGLGRPFENQYLYISLYSIHSKKDLFQSLGSKIINAKKKDPDKIMSGKNLFAIANLFFSNHMSTAPSMVEAYFCKHNPIIVLDDVERSGLSAVECMSLANLLNEVYSLHVILISNEKEISNSQEYYRIKEKTVSQTLIYTPDINKIFRPLVFSMVSDQGQRNLILLAENELVRYISACESINFRSLRRAIRLVKALLNHVRIMNLDIEVKTQVIKEVIVVVLEVDCNERSIYSLMTFDAMHRTMAYRQSPVELEIRPLYKTYEENPIILLNEVAMIELANRESTNIDLIAKVIVDSAPILKGEAIPSKVLMQGLECSDRDFHYGYHVLMECINNKTYKQADTIMKAFHLLLYLSHLEMIQESQDEIILSCREYVKELVSKNELRDSAKPQNSLMTTFFHLRETLQNHQVEHVYVEELYDLIEKGLAESVKYEFELYSKEIIHALKHNHLKIYDFFHRVENNRYRSDILAFIDPDRLIDAFLESSNAAKRTLIHALDDHFNRTTYASFCQNEKYFVWRSIERFGKVTQGINRPYKPSERAKLDFLKSLVSGNESLTAVKKR